MRSLLILFLLLPLVLFSQTPLYEFRDLESDNSIPSNLNSARSAVFVNIDPVNGSFLKEGDWKRFSNDIHKYLYKMGIDVVMYINDQDFSSGNSSRNFYKDILVQRRVQNLLFLTSTKNGFELVCTTFNKKASLIENNQGVYTRKSNSLHRLMLEFGRDIKRAENPMQNFLIPDRPTFLNALSIVQNSNLKNYPGQIRRNKMAIEKFGKIQPVENASEELTQRINAYNSRVDEQNQELVELLKSFPYEIEFVDYMSDEDLLRKRYQFVLRNIYASGESIKSMLKYSDPPSDAGYVSVIPSDSSSTSIKTFPSKTLLYKFYIRQNIAKNVFVGEWDADVTWQNSLSNYIGNMMQYFNRGN